MRTGDALSWALSPATAPHGRDQPIMVWRIMIDGWSDGGGTFPGRSDGMLDKVNESANDKRPVDGKTSCRKTDD